MSDKPLRNVPFGGDLTVKIIGVVLRERVANKLLTLDGLNAISARTTELLEALANGKVLDIEKSGSLVIREATTEEQNEMDARPNEFPISKGRRKTLDI